MTEQPPRIWWSPSLSAEAGRGSLMAGLMWRHVSGQGYVEPEDLPEDAVELAPVAAVGDVTPSLIGPMSRRIGQLGYALRRLADRVEQEWVAPTPPVREALLRAREVIADNTIVAEPVSPVDAETVERAARAAYEAVYNGPDALPCDEPPGGDRWFRVVRAVAAELGVQVEAQQTVTEWTVCEVDPNNVPPVTHLPVYYRSDEAERDSVYSGMPMWQRSVSRSRWVEVPESGRVEARHREAGAATHQTRRRLEPPCMACGQDRREVAPDECKDKRSHRQESGSGDTTEEISDG